jgi:1-aminocyclopropane-1-carboxylate deaminase/D-cysteine desulfhydrase-like pyridoxal-dependent ACC family enzyme
MEFGGNKQRRSVYIVLEGFRKTIKSSVRVGDIQAEIFGNGYHNNELEFLATLGKR